MKNRFWIVLLLLSVCICANARPTRKLAFYIVCDSRLAWQRQVRAAMVARLQAFRDERDLSRYALPILTYYIDDPTTCEWCAHLRIQPSDAPVVGLGQARQYVIVRVARQVFNVRLDGIEAVFHTITEVGPAIRPAAPPLIPMVPLPR